MTDEVITATAHYVVGHAKNDSRGYVPYFMTVLRERLKNGVLTIAVIRGKRRRKTAHTLMMQDMEVIAPNWHEAVAKYRKNGGREKLKKFDYTSYDDNIPYYTMIVYENKEKIKLLLDLNDSMLEAVKRVYPQKVYMR